VIVFKQKKSSLQRELFFQHRIGARSTITKSMRQRGLIRTLFGCVMVELVMVGDC